jgi:hypothetical protein
VYLFHDRGNVGSRNCARKRDHMRFRYNLVALTELGFRCMCSSGGLCSKGSTPSAPRFAHEGFVDGTAPHQAITAVTFATPSPACIVQPRTTGLAPNGDAFDCATMPCLAESNRCLDQ